MKVEKNIKQILGDTNIKKELVTKDCSFIFYGL